jgi:hypothetical protein
MFICYARKFIIFVNIANPCINLISGQSDITLEQNFQLMHNIIMEPV